MEAFVNKDTQEPGGKRHPHPLITILILSLAALFCARGQPASAQLPDGTQDYTIQLIEPPEGAVAVWYTLMNESGLVAMQYGLPDDDPRFFGHTAVLEKGTWKNIDVPGSISTGVGAPSSSGCVPVTYVREEAGGVFAYHSAVYHRGAFTVIPDHETYQFVLNSMNDRGTLVGVIADPEIPGVYRGVRLNSSLSVFEVFDVPESSLTAFFGINNASLIVGRYERDGERPGFLYDGRIFTDISVPGALKTAPESINNNKVIAGSYVRGDGSWNGFMLEKGVLKDFTIPAELVTGELYYTLVDCITDNGRLSGEFGDDNGDHGFIATPKPGRK